jgi:putative ABC transport system permease protein
VTVHAGHPPPPWAERLLHRALSAAVYRDEIVGDLHEAYGAMSARFPKHVADGWYVAEAIRLAARYAARRTVSWPARRQALNHSRKGTHMDRLLMDVRFALRSLAKRPLMTATVVLTLAAGIGANAAVFGVIDALVLHPYAMRDVDRIVMPVTTSPTFVGRRDSVSPADFLDWRRDMAGGAIEHLAAIQWWDGNLVGRDEPERVLGFFVSAGFFAALDAHPALGRTFLQEEETAGNQRRVMLSDGLWRRRFGADPSIVGKPVLVDAAQWIVVGVMPPGFDFPMKSEMWAPLSFDEKAARQRSSHELTVIGRLSAGRSLSEAQAQMAVIAQRLAREHPDTNRQLGVRIYTLSGGMSDVGLPPILSLWQAAGLFVLLIACSNIANLLLARAAERGREIGIRLALGSSRARIVRDSFLESGLLALAAIPLALVIASVFLRLLHVFMPGRVIRFIAGWDRLGVDARVTGITLAIGAIATLACGTLPALQMARGQFSEALKADGRTGTGGQRQRLRRGLVVAEIALALPLLVAAMLSVTTVTRYLTDWQGYDPAHVLTLRLVLPDARYPDADSRRRFVAASLDAIDAAPGVENVTIASVLPAEDVNTVRRIEVRGQPPADAANRPAVDYRTISPSYFDVLRTPLLAGRRFAATDQPASEQVAIVSQSMARKYWPQGDAIGGHVRIANGEWATVVGICGDVIHDWFDSRNVPTLFRPIAQEPAGDLIVAARTSADPRAAVDDVRRAVAQVDRTQPLFDIMPMQQMLAEKTIGLQYIAAVMGVFAALAVILAVLGLYAVMTYLVAQRVREIGVRMALGATRSDVTRLTLRQAARLTIVGVAVGLALALALGRAMEAGLLGIVSSDARLTTALALVLGVTALAASYLPARRAASIDPIVALRNE